MKGTWIRRCHRCDRDFHSDTKHGKVCPDCIQRAWAKKLEMKRPAVHAMQLFAGRMEKIRKLGALLA